MSIKRARAYLKEFGMEERIMELAESSATVELAAEALHCEPERIAKTLSFLMGEQPILIVAAGDARIDNHKYKTTFGTKSKNDSGSGSGRLYRTRRWRSLPFWNQRGYKSISR